MSHWKSGELKLICTEQEVLNGLYSLVGEEWAARWKELQKIGKLQISSSGNLVGTEYSGNVIKGASIVVKKGEESGLRYSDLVVAKKGKEWTVTFDSPLPGCGISEPQELMTKLKIKIADVRSQKAFSGSSHKIESRVEDAGTMQVKYTMVSRLAQGQSASDIKKKMNSLGIG